MARELLAESLRSIRAHCLRTFLTAAGVAWGVALFVVLACFGRALRSHYQEQTEAVGRHVVYAIGGSRESVGAGRAGVRRIALERDDTEHLLKTPSVKQASSEVWGGFRTLKAGGRIKVVVTVGVGAEFGGLRNFRIDRGRFLTARDVAEQRRVLVIGAKVEQRLFGSRSALDRLVRLEGHSFRVVGVSAPKGPQMLNLAPRDDEQVLLPITTMQVLFTGSKEVNWLLYEPRTLSEAVHAKERVRAILARRHRFSPADGEALSLFDVRESLALIRRVGVSVQLFLTACGILTLVVGGIGVVNIMLVAVSERTSEIGVRRALGASRRDVFLQFLCEAIVVTIGAGMAGIALGAALVTLVGRAHRPVGPIDFLLPRVNFSVDYAIVAFALIVMAGVFAGLMPARRAALLDPSAALRGA